MTNDEKLLCTLVYGVTKDKKFVDQIYSQLREPNEIKAMIDYITINKNITLNDINHKALEIVAPRWGINV